MVSVTDRVGCYNRGMPTVLIRRSLILIFLFFLLGCCKKEEVPALTSKLYSTEARDRNDAALALARCGSYAERAVPRLAELIYDDNVGVQSAAAYALRKIDTPLARSVMERADKARGR